MGGGVLFSGLCGLWCVWLQLNLSIGVWPFKNQARRTDPPLIEGKVMRRGGKAEETMFTARDHTPSAASPGPSRMDPFVPPTLYLPALLKLFLHFLFVPRRPPPSPSLIPSPGFSRGDERSRIYTHTHKHMHSHTHSHDAGVLTPIKCPTAARLRIKPGGGHGSADLQIARSYNLHQELCRGWGMCACIHVLVGQGR